MGLEVATYVNDLTTTNPLATDQRKQGDDHLRLIKSVLKTTFPNADRAMYHPEYLAKTGNYTVQSTDDEAILGCSTSGGAFTITLPTTLTASQDGFCVRIVKLDTNANALTVAPSAGTVMGQASFKLYNAGAVLKAIWNGSTWLAEVTNLGVDGRAITATSTTIDETHFEKVLLVAPASANATLNLPAVASYVGRLLTVVLNSATYTCTLDPNGAETIDGAATLLLATQYEHVTLFGTSGGWITVGSGAAASSSGLGLVELATEAETLTGTDAGRAVTPDSLYGLWGKLADIASAGTITVGAGGYAHVTGTTTITDIDFSTATDARWVWLVFDAVLTLTHNATTLILPGGENIVTAAGDAALFIQDSADNVKCVVYQRASGQPVAGAVTREERVTDSSITTNTVLASDDTLKFAMLANTVYGFEAWVLLDVDADSGWKLGTAGPAAPTEVVVLYTYDDDNGTRRTQSQAAFGSLDSNTPGADRIAWLRIKGLIRNGANAGDFALQFAQNVSHATAFVVKRTSWIDHWVNG